ncbi:hypothetical protein F2Q70_00000609 [Brassica cretica]|uniref:Uncharacterized protein n=1 Tax=Brassica cretica TaxID=69181 RepID=A0A8S9INQ3_BRACR|nr:hypothetical protein F2Q70_00000609 [Brassica cretica]
MIVSASLFLNFSSSYQNSIFQRSFCRLVPITGLFRLSLSKVRAFDSRKWWFSQHFFAGFCLREGMIPSHRLPGHHRGVLPVSFDHRFLWFSVRSILLFSLQLVETVSPWIRLRRAEFRQRKLFLSHLDTSSLIAGQLARGGRLEITSPTVFSFGLTVQKCMFNGRLFSELEGQVERDAVLYKSAFYNESGVGSCRRQMLRSDGVVVKGQSTCLFWAVPTAHLFQASSFILSSTV